MLKHSGWLFDTPTISGVFCGNYHNKEKTLHIWGYPVVVLDLEVY